MWHAVNNFTTCSLGEAYLQLREGGFTHPKGRAMAGLPRRIIKVCSFGGRKRTFEGEYTCITACTRSPCIVYCLFYVILIVASLLARRTAKGFCHGFCHETSVLAEAILLLNEYIRSCSSSLVSPSLTSLSLHPSHPSLPPSLPLSSLPLSSLSPPFLPPSLPPSLSLPLSLPLSLSRRHRD